MKEKRKGILIAGILLLLVVLMVCLNGLSQPPETLEGKSMLILGDSYSAGFCLGAAEEAWPRLVADACGMTLYNDSVSGSTLGTRGMEPMVKRCRNLPQEAFDIIVIQGGSNDWALGAPLGDLDSREEETLLGALNCIIDRMQQQYPEAKIVCFTPWVTTGDVNLLGMETTEYVEAIKALCQAREVFCYDASDAEANGIHMEDPVFRGEYCLDPQDRWHLNAQGQALFAPVFSLWLQENLLK